MAQCNKEGLKLLKDFVSVESGSEGERWSPGEKSGGLSYVELRKKVILAAIFQQKRDRSLSQKHFHLQNLSGWNTARNAIIIFFLALLFQILKSTKYTSSVEGNYKTNIQYRKVFLMAYIQNY